MEVVGGRGVMCFFFFNDTATTEIYTLSLHDALPICSSVAVPLPGPSRGGSDPAVSLPFCASPLSRNPFLAFDLFLKIRIPQDRKSTRLNSSHANISYAVFCLKKKKMN